MRLPAAILLIALAGCATSESVRQSADAAKPALEAVQALAEASKPTAEALPALARETTETAAAVRELAGRVSVLVERLTAAVDRAGAFLDRGPSAVDRVRESGAPVDEGFGALLGWAVRHPGEAAGMGGSFLAALLWALVRGRRFAKALRAVTTTVEGAPPDVRSAVKSAVGARFGADRGIRAAIRAAKGSA